jgi:hypothetical protein
VTSLGLKVGVTSPFLLSPIVYQSIELDESPSDHLCKCHNDTLFFLYCQIREFSAIFFLYLLQK